MKIDLGPLPYRRAIELIKWCAENNVDQEHAMRLVKAMATVEQDPDLSWELDVPDEYMTYFALKWL